MLLQTYLSLVFTTFLWGGTFIAGRLLSGTVAPIDSAFLRFAIASVALIPMVFVVDKKLTLPSVKNWFFLTLLGLTGVFAYNVFFFNGLQHITAGRAALIIASTPLAITLLAAVFLGERLTPVKLGGVLICLVGAIVVISNGHPQLLFHGGFGLGERALLGCVASWTAYSLIGRHVLKTVPPLTSVCYSALIGTIFLGFPSLQGGLFSHISGISLTGWLSLLFLGVGGTALGFSMYYMAIVKIGASRSSVFINLVPVFSLLLSWLILDEGVKSVVIFGGILILCGVTLTNYKPQKALD